MDERVLRATIKSFLETDQKNDVYCFFWQGGEPLLAGVEFYRQAVRFQMEYARAGSVIANSIQTNGTLLDEEFAAFFKTYNFSVGLSVDGTESEHGANRCYPSGTSSYSDTVRGVNTLIRHRMGFNTLTVVGNHNAGSAKELFHTLKQWPCGQQYIPMLSQGRGFALTHLLTGEEWGRFLCDLFDVWNTDRSVYVRNIYALIDLLVTGNSSDCRYSPRCGEHCVVEADGEMYPCDFFVGAPYSKGNVQHDAFWQDVTANNFVLDKRAVTMECKECEYFPVCLGDCLAYRVLGLDGFEKSTLCRGWKMFFGYAFSELQSIAKLFMGQIK